MFKTPNQKSIAVQKVLMLQELIAKKFMGSNLTPSATIVKKAWVATD
jgi:hypothetical protein